ncbi:hypothetical protein M407DRAFT_245300 [Tulasnella calospora MUT 4182]|uniref:CFEM domain-containing protein n=1 Tax=Tulasnella calospora MUT 4182 TaxID=1051891 RepID=A0A0C3Q1F9_9AGAM|nr:hypothetical protein M407DRAFT_245300 [Tulasnella calospora MUT 4182]
MKASSLTAVVLVSLAGAAFARPSPQASGVPVPACITTCINQVVGTGACTDASDIECLCSNDALTSCVQSSCPPSFVDALGETCGTGPFSSSSESASSQPLTIQTDTLSGATETPAATTSAASSAVVATTSASSRASPSAASTRPAATSASPAGNAGDLAISAPSLKGIVGMVLAFVAGALLV